MYNIRKTSMTHGIFTDAVTRFSKGQSPAQCMAVLAQAAQMLTEDGATVASAVVDDYQKPLQSITINVSAQFINERLGSDLKTDEIAAILGNVEFTVTVQGDDLAVTVPFWRTDIEIPEDIVEEVGRLRGFDAVPVLLPQRDLTPATPDTLLDIKSRIRHILARAGANEIQSYTFVHGNLLQKVGQNPDKAYKVRNAISPDLQHYRLSLTPSILEKIHPNIKAGYPEFALFELNKVHHKENMHDVDTHLPAEASHVGLVVAADKKSPLVASGAAFYQAKKLLDYLCERLQIIVRYEALSNYDVEAELAAPFDPKRSAVVMSEDRVLGIVGEYKPAMQKAFKLPVFSAGFELMTQQLLNVIEPGSAYVVRSQFPGTEQDITFEIAEEVPFGEVQQAITATLLEKQELQSSVEARDIYQSEGSHKKHVTFRISLQHAAKTLTADDIAAVMHDIEANVGQVTGATRN
jgi:phenylalanyl-tRNA synthetase beta chain